MTYVERGAGDAGVAIIVGLLIGLIAAQLFGPTTKPADAQQTATFDHSQCQYPDRTTNPPDGCDNSDPCDPASAAKGGSGDCEPIGTAEKQQAIAEHSAPFETKPAQPTEAAQCGGK